MIRLHDNFSIVVPTYREAKNIPTLIRRLAEINFGDAQFELIVVDDNSGDGIEALMKDEQARYPWLQFISRRGKKSLSASAVAGFQKAKYSFLVLMDADLSHPPEKIPEMLRALSQNEADFVIGSRYVKGGSADEIWPVTRRLTSRLSAFIARLLVSADIKDPLSGFFALRKTTLHAGYPLKPIGWKIGLELMMRCRCQRIKEIPIHFSQRLHGKSKLNLKVAMDYLLHVQRLMLFKIFS